jgi:hypothetical protein
MHEINMTYSNCPTSIVNAPVEIVWSLLMRPEKWGDFFDVRYIGWRRRGRTNSLRGIRSTTVAFGAHCAV